MRDVMVIVILEEQEQEKKRKNDSRWDLPQVNFFSLCVNPISFGKREKLV